MSYYCYMLRDEKGQKTYVGMTVDPAHRIRQHNGELKGGAKATKGRVNEMFCLIIGLEKQESYQCEWRLKHPAKKKKFHRPEGKIRGLNYILRDELDKWTNNSIKKISESKFIIYITSDMYQYLDIPAHFEVVVDDYLDLDHAKALT